MSDGGSTSHCTRQAGPCPACNGFGEGESLQPHGEKTFERCDECGGSGVDSGYFVVQKLLRDKWLDVPGCAFRTEAAAEDCADDLESKFPQAEWRVREVNNAA